MEKKETKPMPPDYEVGELDVLGGGYVDWWHSYIKSEVAACNEYWREMLRDNGKLDG